MNVEETVFDRLPPQAPSGSSMSGASGQGSGAQASALQRGSQLFNELGLGDVDVEEVMEQAREAATVATDYIRENPARALAVAAAVGALAGWLAGRR